MARNRVKTHACANCGFQFSSEKEHTNYCPNCGQENHNPRYPLVHYGYELLEGFLHFDTKFLYSLKVLLFRPGKMTYEYIHNIRGRYMPPFRMFIFISIITLVMMGVFEKYLFSSGNMANFSYDPSKKSMTISEIFDQSADSLTDQVLPPPFSWVLKNPTVTNADLRKLKMTQPDGIGAWLTAHGYDNNPLTRFFAANKKLRISRQMTVAETATMVSNIFKWLFLIMIPVMAFIFFVVFYRKGLYYYDSLLFSVHFMSFLLFYILLTEMLVLGLSLIHLSLPAFISGILLLLLLAYITVAVKTVFRFNWLSTVIRLVVSILLTMTVYQLIHYTISMYSGK